jgi:hypothetical protein
LCYHFVIYKSVKKLQNCYNVEKVFNSVIYLVSYYETRKAHTPKKGGGFTIRKSLEKLN